MTIYFKKELPQNVVMDGKGRKIPFETLNDSIGVAAFSMDDGTEFEYIEALRKLTAARKGGVMELTEEQFVELKKKSSSMTSNRRPKESAVKVLKPVSPYRPRQNAEPAVEADAEPKQSEPVQEEVKVAAEPQNEPAKTTEAVPTSSVETDDAPWNDVDESPRTAKVSHGDTTDIPPAEADSSE